MLTFLSSVFSSTSTRISGALSVLFAAACCFIPLVHILGYESSALAGAVIPFLCIPFWFPQMTDTHSEDLAGEGTPQRPWRVWLHFLICGLLLALPGPFFLLLNALRVRNCSLFDGALFFLLIVPISLSITALWALCIRTLIPRKVWLQRTVFVACILFSALSSLLFTAFEPPIVAHHPLIGYFAGSIYDEALSIPTPLIIYRAWNLGCVALSLVGLDVAWRRRHQQWDNIPWLGTFAALLSCVLLAVYTQRAPLGLEIDRDHIETKLAHRHETEHFVLHVSPTSWHSKHIDAVALDHEVRFAQLEKSFGSVPFKDSKRKIHSYIYPNSAVKGQLMGGRRTMVAKLWLGEMHIVYPNLGFPILTHEMAHVFSRPYGTGPLMLSAKWGIFPNMGLVEGLAEAAEWDRDELSPHMWSASMRALKLAPDIRSLVRAEGFYQSASSKSYTLMGSFVRFLIDTYGMETFLKAYAQGDFQNAYAKNPDALVREWELFVDGHTPTPDTLALASFYFDRKSIFSKVCARTLAALRIDAQRLADQGLQEEALSCLHTIRKHRPKDPATHIRLIRLLVRFERTEEALQEIEQTLKLDTLSSAHRATVHISKGDILWRQGKREAAQTSWKACLMPGLPWSTRRAVQARLVAEDNPYARDYFVHPDRASLALYNATAWAYAEKDSALAWYILGRNLWQRRAWTQARNAFKRALKCSSFAPLPPALRAETYRLVAESALADHAYDEARDAFTHIATDSEFPDGLRARARDGLDRVQWTSSLHKTKPAP